VSCRVPKNVDKTHQPKSLRGDGTRIGQDTTSAHGLGKRRGEHNGRSMRGGFPGGQGAGRGTSLLHGPDSWVLGGIHSKKLLKTGTKNREARRRKKGGGWLRGGEDTRGGASRHVPKENSCTIAKGAPRKTLEPK